MKFSFFFFNQIMEILGTRMISTAVRVSFGHDGMRMSSTIASISFNRRLVSWLKENVLRNFSYVFGV